jgi:DNA-binding CsgD family transcriptional regulator
MVAILQRTEKAMVGAGAADADHDIRGLLAEALGTTLDSLAVGIVIVANKGRILHANQAARLMLATKSPIQSHGGCLAAREARATQELREAIAEAEHEGSRIGVAGIGVPLVGRDMTAATAHVLPLGRPGTHVESATLATASVFVTRAECGVPADLDIVARIFGFTPAETRLLTQLVTGASLGEAATALGVSEATAKTHRNHIFMKAGVSRRTDLLTLIGRLVPPILRTA